MSIQTKVQCQLTSIRQYATDVFRLEFAIDRKYTRFKPGQFLHLTLEDFDPTQAYWPESRVFSICSPPRSSSVSVIYSVKGEYTRRMRRELREGGEYWLKLPYGDFIIDDLVPQGATAVLIAGGTGISPYIAFLEQGLQHGFSRTTYLAYAVRSSARLAFETTLRRAAAAAAVSLRVWSEGDGERADLITDVGRLNLHTVVGDVAALPTPHYLLSGPPSMLNTFSRELTTKYAVDPNRIHIDEWE